VGLQQVGAEAVVGGYAEFMQRIERMTQKLNALGGEAVELGRQARETDQLAASMETIEEQASKMGKQALEADQLGNSMKVMGDKASQSMSFMDKLGLGFVAGVGGAIGMKAMNTLYGLQSSIMGIGKQAVESASRVGEMTLTSRLLGATVGLSTQQVDSQIFALRKLNMTSQAANELVQQFSRYQIDMGMATKLASAAQDLAVLSGKDSSETVQDLIYGITTLNPMVLRTAGINVSTAQAYDKFAASAGTTVDALTDEQRVQAFLNATLEDAIPLQGAYSLAMESGSKVMRSLSGRVIPELITVVGMPFQEAYTNVAKTFYALASALSLVFEKGGALYPIIQTLGAVFSVATEGMRSFAEGLLSTVKTTEGAGSEMVNNIARPILQAVERAATWGFGIVANLADGIISGASFVLTAAMQFVGQVLASWLASGSPPAVAPDLPKWGMSAMNEWLKGFTEGDFSILEGIQGQLKSVLDIKDMSDQFLGYSAMITSAIADWSKTGVISADVFTKLEAIGGELGSGIAELARRRFALAAATKAQTDAEKALKAAQDGQLASQNKIDLLVRQYNELRRGDASKAVLRQKALELAAATKERDAANDAIKAAEVQKTAAEGNVKTYGDQVQLQEKILSQLVEGQRALAAMAGTPGAPGAGLEGLAALQEALAKPLQKPNLSEIMKTDDAFEDLKKKVTGHWDDMTKDLRDKWKDNMKPTLDELSGSFSDFLGVLRQVHDALFGKAVEPTMMEQALQHAGVPKLEKISGGLLEEKGWEEVGKALATAFWEAFRKEFQKGLGEVFSGKPLDIFGGKPWIGWEAPKGPSPLMKWLSAEGPRAGEWVEKTLWPEIVNQLTNPKAGLTTTMSGAAQAIVDALGQGLMGAAGGIANLADIYSKWADDLFASLSKKWDEIKADASKKWDEFKDEIIRIAKKLWTDLVGGSVISDIEDDVRKTWERMLAKATEVWNNIKSAIVTPITAARDEASRILGELETNFKTTIGNIQTFLDDPKAGFLLALSNLQAGFQKVGDYVKDTLGENLKNFLEEAVSPLADGWNAIKDAVGWTLGKLEDLWNWISSHSLPQWFTDLFGHHSPPDLALGFTEIASSTVLLSDKLKPLFTLLGRALPAKDLLRWSGNFYQSLLDLLDAWGDLGEAMVDRFVRTWTPAVQAAISSLQARIDALRKSVEDLNRELSKLPNEPSLPPRGGISSAASYGPVAMPLALAPATTAGAGGIQNWNFQVTTAGGLAAITQSYAIARALAGA
jgi:hypothetical protein